LILSLKGEGVKGELSPAPSVICSLRRLFTLALILGAGGSRTAPTSQGIGKGVRRTGFAWEAGGGGPR